MKVPNQQASLDEYEWEITEDNLNDLKIQQLLAQFDLNHEDFNPIATITTFRAVYQTADYDLCFDYNLFDHFEDFEIEYEYRQDHDGLTNFNRILEPINQTYVKNAPAKIARALKPKD